MSVIIPFHDEHLSVLLRSIYSIVRRTPESLLQEIILVDDFSTKGITSNIDLFFKVFHFFFIFQKKKTDFLKGQLDEHIKANFKKDLVKILRLNKREGLIRTRVHGARAAKGDVLVFFDSHIECGINWAPPLLEPIAYNYKTAVCPFIDVINENSFSYSAQDEGARGAFDWDMFYKRLPLLESDLAKPAEPFE